MVHITCENFLYVLIPVIFTTICSYYNVYSPFNDTVLKLHFCVLPALMAHSWYLQSSLVASRARLHWMWEKQECVWAIVTRERCFLGVRFVKDFDNTTCFQLNFHRH